MIITGKNGKNKLLFQEKKILKLLWCKMSSLDKEQNIVFFESSTDLKNIEKVRILLGRIRSIVFSMKIKKQNEKKIRDNFIFTLDKMLKENFEYPKFKKNLDSINKYQEKIVSILNEAKKYSRFKGFEDEKLFDFIENKSIRDKYYVLLKKIINNLNKVLKINTLYSLIVIYFESICSI